MDPRIYVGIDNCFASKRWAQPEEWMKVIKDIGLTYIEASADTECDPMYHGREFTEKWIRDVKNASDKTGSIVKNLYSGHGTYATCGITHYDSGVIARFRDQWMKSQTDTAAALGAGFGFFAHGIEECVLNDTPAYNKKLNQLYETLADLALYAAEKNVRFISLEQMYSPHQPPWTIQSTKILLEKVYALSKAPFYITLDVGHMNGQQYFQKPSAESIENAVLSARAGTPVRRLWMGSSGAYAAYKAAVYGEISLNDSIDIILEEADRHPHLFASEEDYSVSSWLGAFGCYSPIVHLQQTDGKSSPHWPFTKQYNKIGIVDMKNVLKDLERSYSACEENSMPPPCDEIVLTLEPFISTAGNIYDLLNDLAESVLYIRKYIPKDGLRLSEIVKNLPE